MGRFDQIIDDTLAQQGIDGSRSLISAVDTSPDEAGKALQQSRRYGIPVDALGGRPDEELSRRALIEDANAAVQKSPTLRDWLATNPVAAPIARDDFDNISAVDQAVKYLTRGSRALAAGLYGRLPQGLYGAGQAVTETMASADPAASMPTTAGVSMLARYAAPFFAWGARESGKVAEQVAGDRSGAGMVEESVYSGIESVGLNIGPMVVSVMTGNPTPALATMSTTSGGLSYLRAREAGLSPTAALPYATTDAMIEYVTERIPLVSLLGEMKAGSPFYRILADQMVKEGLTEQAATFLQDANEWAALNPDKTVAEFLAERPNAALQTAISTAVATTMQTGGVAAVQKVAERRERQLAQAEAAQNDMATRFEELNTLAEASKVRERDVETFESFIQQASQDAPVQDVFISANALMQSGMAKKVAELSPTVAQQLAVAQATGGMVRIPLHEVVGRLGGETAKPLLEHLKTDPNGFSKAEADEYVKEHADALKADVEREIAKQSVDDEFNASRERVAAGILTQLQSVNRFTEDVNKPYAALVAARYATLAEQMGMTPEQVAQQYPLRIVGQPVEGLDQPAYHGTPHAVDRFSLHKIGTGEGAQAYGWGLYFAGKREVAEHYRKTLSDSTAETGAVLVNGEKLDAMSPEGHAARLLFYNDKREMRTLAKEMLKDAKAGAPYAEETAKRQGLSAVEYYSRLEQFVSNSSKRNINVVKGNLYSVEIPDDDKLLDFDKSLSAQPEYVKQKLADSGVMKDWKDSRSDYSLPQEVRPNKGGALYALLSHKLGGDQAASQFLREIGIVGMRFKAGQLSGVKGGGHNYVIWDEGAISPPTSLYQSAYHGSPHDFQQFSLDKIGTGEGAQMYGWGLYFAEARDVAAGYFRSLADNPGIKQMKLGSMVLNERNSFDYSRRASESDRENIRATLAENLLVDENALHGIGKNGFRDHVLAELDDMILRYEAEWPDAVKPAQELRRMLEAPGALEIDFHPVKGGVYSVDIPDDAVERMLDWDKSLSQQPDKVKESLKAFGIGSDKSPDDMSDLELVGALGGFENTLGRGEARGEKLYRELSAYFGGDKAASEKLGAAGIPGLRYDDANSRGQGGTKNIVIWDQSVIDQLNQQVSKALYQNRGGPRGAFDPQTRTIALLRASDLSTFLHEAGHFFLELQAEIASQPNAPVEVQEDMGRILNWFGIKETPERTALDVWRSMTLNEQREYHEKFARGFEAYLFEGKSPNVTMRGVFQRFRAWLLNVYRELKALNVELNDEIRGVFDRMLASQQEIADAQAGRSMGMLFESQEEAAKFGVDWRQYHDQGLAATEQAVSELQTKSLGDLRWLDGARSRLLKKMQQQAARQRREVRAEVRGEVLARPVYRAWKFLTGKAPVIDKPKSSKAADPTRDSMFDAIRKLGGINKDELVSTWGADPSVLSEQNRIKTRTPLAPPKGGKTIDGMAEALSELGYLSTDENGKWDLAQFEEKFDAESRGNPQWSYAVDPDVALGIEKPVSIDGLARGKLDTDELRMMYGEKETAVWRKLSDLGMTSTTRGLPVDAVAGEMGFTSGDEMVQALATATDPATVIEAETDKRMLELYGDTYTPEGMAQAVDEALHNEARTRMTATELGALEKAMNPRTPAGEDRRGRPRTQATLPAAAKAFAESLIAGLTLRGLYPTQYVASADRARKAAAKALKSGKVPEAAMEKRNQLINEYAAKAAMSAREEFDKGVEYLKSFAKDTAGKRIDPDYLDQIHGILEKFDLRRSVSFKEIERRKSLADWIAEQEELGIEPELPPHVRADALRVSYKELSLEQFRGVVDSVKQIEHLGRIKKKLLLARDARELEAVLNEIRTSIAENAPEGAVDNRTRNTGGNRAVRLFDAFLASHRKVASLARELDGFKDGGPMWSHFIRSMNERGDFEASRRAKATQELAALLAPVSKLGRMSGKGMFIKELGLSLNREERLTVALNMGNAGNIQRLMDGRGWSPQGVAAVLDTLTKEEWDFVQGVWDHFETYRPEIAEKQRRVFGFEPQWVEPQPVVTKFGTLRGGYYPIVYDPRESAAAESNEEAEIAQRMLKGAKMAATTRRTFTKTRADEIKGRPLLMTLDGMFRGVNDVIHDLAWHEWIIDANRILKGIDPTVRSKYGAEVVRQFRAAVRDIAAGEVADMNALNRVVGPLRTGASVAGLGLNLVNVALQGLGITQSMVRIGPKWVAKGIAGWARSPIGLAKDVFTRSEFMRNRVRTFNRELNELQSVVRDQNKVKAKLDRVMFAPMQIFQMGVDLPTWWGAYQKALGDGVDEAEAVARADQAVIDAQGGGQVKDLAAIQRGPEVLKLFTVFYGFFSTTYNLAVERGKATKYTSPVQVARLAMDYLILFSIPAVLGEFLRIALTGGGGDEDEEELAKRLAAAQVSYLMGTMVGLRETTGAVQSALGVRQYAGGYGGPAGLRFLQELDKLGQQVGQGEFDRALVRSAVNVAGVTLHLPSAQINRTIDGIIALEEGKTDNPVALIGGPPAEAR